MFSRDRIGWKADIGSTSVSPYLRRMKRFVILGPILAAANGCSGPVTSSQDLNGCYFAAGSDWIFKIADGHLADRGGRILSTVSLTQSTLHDSVAVLTPGIRLTESPQKSMVVVQGDTRRLLAVKWQTGVHLVAVDIIGRIDFRRGQCAQ